MKDDGIEVPSFVNNNTNTGYKRGESTPLVQYNYGNGTQGRGNDSRRSSSSRRPHVDRMEEDLRRCRRQSVGNGPINTVVEVVGIVTEFFNNLKHSFVAGLMAGIMFGAPIGAYVVNSVADNQYQNSPIVQRVDDEIIAATHRTVNNDGHYYDVATLARKYQDEIENGASPYIVLGALASNMTDDYKQDDLDEIVNMMFKVDCGADDLVRMIDPERYADGIHGDNFMNDYKTLSREDYRTQGLTESDDLLRRFYYQNNDLTPDSNQELNEMMQDGEQQDSVSNEKGLGGK